MSIDALFLIYFLLIICVYVHMYMSATVWTFDCNLYYGIFMYY